MEFFDSFDNRLTQNCFGTYFHVILAFAPVSIDRYFVLEFDAARPLKSR